jgi:hypothetical protein
MQFKTYLQSKLPFFVALSFAFVLASCGSYQYAGYDNDGIYNTSEPNTSEETPYVEATPADNKSYYKDYFAEKSKQFENISQDDNVIFTNIDDYEGDYADEAESPSDDYDGYAGWGQNNDNITINVNYGFGGYYNSFRPYYRWGWYSPIAWNYGWGYAGYYDGYYPYYGYYGGYYPYYGYYGGYYPYYGYGHYHGYYNGYYNRNVTHVNGRRGSLYSNTNRNTSVNRRSSSLNNSRSSITRTRANTSNTRSTTPRRVNANTPRTRNTRVNTNTPQTRSSSTINNNSIPRRSSTTINTPTRRSSSGVSRSSGGSSRSSGGSSRRGN